MIGTNKSFAGCDTRFYTAASFTTAGAPISFQWRHTQLDARSRFFCAATKADLTFPGCVFPACRHTQIVGHFLNYPASPRCSVTVPGCLSAGADAEQSPVLSVPMASPAAPENSLAHRGWQRSKGGLELLGPAFSIPSPHHYPGHSAWLQLPF